MKKIEIHLFELTPEEVRNLPPKTFVLCYDSIFKKYTSLKSAPDLKFEVLPGCHFFVFDKPEGVAL